MTNLSEQAQLEALVTRRQGMVASNVKNSFSRKPPKYSEDDFSRLAEQMIDSCTPPCEDIDSLRDQLEGAIKVQQKLNKELSDKLEKLQIKVTLTYELVNHNLGKYYSAKLLRFDTKQWLWSSSPYVEKDYAIREAIEAIERFGWINVDPFGFTKDAPTINRWSIIREKGCKIIDNKYQVHLYKVKSHEEVNKLVSKNPELYQVSDLVFVNYREAENEVIRLNNLIIDNIEGFSNQASEVPFGNYVDSHGQPRGK